MVSNENATEALMTPDGGELLKDKFPGDDIIKLIAEWCSSHGVPLSEETVMFALAFI